jgi:hypothetical protein
LNHRPKCAAAPSIAYRVLSRDRQPPQTDRDQSAPGVRKTAPSGETTIRNASRDKERTSPSTGACGCSPHNRFAQQSFRVGEYQHGAPLFHATRCGTGSAPHCPTTVSSVCFSRVAGYAAVLRFEVVRDRTVPYASKAPKHSTRPPPGRDRLCRGTLKVCGSTPVFQ